MKTSLIIFDLDGTLVDTSLDLTNSLNAALSPHGLEPLTKERTKELVGEGVSNLITKILAPEKREDLFDRVLGDFIAHYTEHVADESAPYPGVMDTLNGRLSDYRKAVLTNKRTNLSVKLLEALGMMEHFELVAGPEDVPAQKPDPAGALHLLDKLGADKDEAVLVGDSEFDVLTGRNAGIRTAAVAYGFRPRMDLLDADVLIDRFADLPAAIKGLDSLSDKL
jgi:phosphoglycolate phosphatase